MTGAPGLSDDALRALVRRDAATGWRALIDQYTPLIVGTIRRAGLVDRDEVMEVYLLLCEQLTARGFDRLKRQDGARGSIGGWLTVLVRHAIVDWIRSRKGRRRLFHAVQQLPRFEQRVFEMYYWEDRTPSEMTELLAQELGQRTTLAGVLEALERVQAALSDRHRAELFALAVRSHAPVPIDDTDAPARLPDRRTPELDARVSQLNAQLERALKQLPAEDAAIVRLKYVEGLTNADIEHAIGAPGVTARRVQEILSKLRAMLESMGVDAADAALANRLSLDRSTT